MDLITEIKSRLSLEQLLAYLDIPVSRSGFIKSIYKEEKTPSLKIDLVKNYYYDFSIGEGGDVIKFYKDYYRTDYKEAIKQLSSLAGISHAKHITPSSPAPHLSEPEVLFHRSDFLPVELEEFNCQIAEHGSEEIALKAVKALRIKLNTQVFHKFFEICLSADYDNAIYRYLMDDRMINKQFIWKFKLFTIDNYFRVNDELKSAFSPERLHASGLVNDNNNLIFAKHRLIIPYLWDNKIVYLRGRWFDKDSHTPDGAPKYIGLRNDSLKVNTPKRFFNAFQLKSMLKGERIFITEGEFDTIIAEQLGFASIAVPGVGNISPRIELLKNFRVVLCLDNDLAGKTATDKLIKIFIDNNIEYSLADLHDKDITEWYKNKVLNG